MRNIWSKQFWRGNRDAHAPLTPAAREQRQRRFVRWFGVGLALALWAILALQPAATPGLQVGSPSPASIQSPRTVSFVSKLLTDQARSQAESSTDTLVFQRDPTLPTSQRLQLSGLLQTISQIRSDPTIQPDAKQNKLANLPNSTLVISGELALQIARFSDDDWSQVASQSLQLYDRAMEQYRYDLNDQAVQELRERSLPYWSAQRLLGTQRDVALLFSSSFVKANRVLDEDATRQRKDAAISAIEPVHVTMQQGESIVRQGDLVTPEIAEKLAAAGVGQTQTNWLYIAGTGILAGLVAALFSFYLNLAHPALGQSKRVLAVIGSLFALTVLAARLVLPLMSNWPYAFPLATTALLLAALFHRNLALVATALIGLLISFLSDGQFNVHAALVLGSFAGIYVIGRPERSLTFLWAGLIIAFITALTQTALILPTINDTSLGEFWPLLVFSGMNGALSAILALALFNLTGLLAGIATSFQLMELAHPAQPLLRKLMREAPGTYSHSVSVGNLAESAAEAIGADALLLRVAAYYHDIGKSVRPYFFTDNQSDRENVHNDLDPRISAEIIADHVREGARMAREAGLPRELIEFIPTHHGTSVIKHFYQLALQRQDTVELAEFSYPGPKPQTREHAILMLADTVEATVRSNAQHGRLLSARNVVPKSNGNGNGGKQTLEEMVSAIIDERVRSGQLDESDLTLHDLARIRQAFISTLQGIYHPRVEYAPQLIKS